MALHVFCGSVVGSWCQPLPQELSWVGECCTLGKSFVLMGVCAVRDGTHECLFPSWRRHRRRRIYFHRLQWTMASRIRGGCGVSWRGWTPSLGILWVAVCRTLGESSVLMGIGASNNAPLAKFPFFEALSKNSIHTLLDTGVFWEGGQVGSDRLTVAASGSAGASTRREAPGYDVSSWLEVLQPYGIACLVHGHSLPNFATSMWQLH